MASNMAQKAVANLANISVGSRFYGRINNITALGIFVTIDRGHSGLVHRSDFTDWPNDHERYQIGDEVRVVVLSNENNRIGLSLSRLDDPALVDTTNIFSLTAPEEFEATLSQTLDEANQTIKQLEEQNNGR